MEESEKIYELQIKKGREHRAVLTPNRINCPSEFFYNAYQDAKYQLQEIVLASYRNQKREQKEPTTKRRIELLHEYPNNVIAFCADRGRGKTTAMLSFSNALEALGNSPENRPQDFWGTLPAVEHPLDARFEVMAPIDPAAMENTDSVLQQIISQLFENFCREAKRRSRYESGGKKCDREELSDKFQKCAQAIDALYKSEKTPDTLIEDELDKIAEIGQSGKLLLLLHEMINKYLDFMQNDEGPKRCLVVQIDDADMDIGRSYQILEDVRKYLGLPRVIVLMATNLQQLETTVEQHFLKEYEHGLKYGDSMITVERCHEIAVLYLEKAIPHPRRIYLPDIGETIRQHLSQLRVNYQEPDDPSNGSADAKESKLLSENGTYQEQLLELLHRKTGMVFTFGQDYLHNLLPAHMRELCQFLPFFVSMEDVSDGYKIAAETFQNQGFSASSEVPQQLNQWEQSLKRLEFYLVNLWSAINLREGSRNLFREFVAQPENVRNLYLLRNIRDYYVRERVSSERAKSAHEEYEVEFADACTQRGINLNSYLTDTVQGEMSVSYADVMGVLTALTDLPGANRQYKFAYAVRLFYSIRLHITLIQEIRMIGNGTGTNDFRTLTDLLRDTLLKSGPINDTKRTPFGFWRLEMPVQWFAADSSQNGETTYVESPFLRRKFVNDHMIRMISTIESKGELGVRRPVGIALGQEDKEVVVFSPLYPLLDALDRFAYFQNTKPIKGGLDMYVHMAQIYIALLVCLNWDVQRVLFKRVKNQTGDTVKNMVIELYSRYIADLVKLIPRKLPSWLFETITLTDSRRPQSSFDTLWEKNGQELFDILTTRVRPVTVFKAYIQKANDGLNQFNEKTEAFQDLIEKMSLPSFPKTMKEFWKMVDNEPAGDSNNQLILLLWAMDDGVVKALSSDAVNNYIKQNLSEDEKLYILLSDFFRTTPISLKKYPRQLIMRRGSAPSVFSLKRCALTPAEVKSALEQYIGILKGLLEQGPDSADGKSPRTGIFVASQATSATNSNAVQSGITETTAAAPGVTPAADPEAAMKALQGLLQLGQQLLNTMTFLQQNGQQQSSQPTSQEGTVDPQK